MHVYTHTHMQTHTHMHVCMHTCAHIRMHSCTHILLHTNITTHTHAHTHTCMCAHTHAHTCLHIHTYACVHTKTFSCNISSESANNVLQCESVQWIHSVFCLTVSTEQQRIVTCGSDRLLKVIDMETLTELFAKDVQHEILWAVLRFLSSCMQHLCIRELL